MKINTFRITALCACFLLAPGTRAADEQQAEKSKPKPAPAPLTVPAGAVQKDANTYTYTDEAGKKWIYRRTPFGVTRFEPRDTTSADQENVRKDAALIQAFDDGDSVRFERPGPFGVYRWKQKKTELSAVEQAAWDRARAPKDGAREKE
jgi:hypothetical protein